MNSRIDELMARIHELQCELEADLAAKREQFRYRFDHHRIRFEDEVLELHRRLRTSSLHYLLRARLWHLLSAPVIYGVALPLLLADLGFSIYQAICFPIYRIPKVRRADHFVYDRALLPYLNRIEQFNCLYCSYVNGLMAYGREIVARTEQYWCPIKHARRLRASHDRYEQFFDYGDAQRYARELEAMRERLADADHT
ncbi:MAG: hypothetical protein AB7U92_00910 [Piscinibacter sp.]|jgi:hypothetical protein|uniref:hypothetical protein n=1 Tax=Piscinibacter sp. TaxID=1903157 RepID=UPI003D0A03D1